MLIIISTVHLDVDNNFPIGSEYPKHSHKTGGQKMNEKWKDVCDKSRILTKKLYEILLRISRSKIDFCERRLKQMA